MEALKPPFVKEITLRRGLVLTLSCMALVLVLPALYAIQRFDEIRDIRCPVLGKRKAQENKNHGNSDCQWE